MEQLNSTQDMKDPMLLSLGTSARTAHGYTTILSDDVIAHILGYTQDPATVISSSVPFQARAPG